MDVVAPIYAAVRYTVAAAFLIALLIALIYWAARRGKISAFGWLARGSRRLFDPIMRPLERRVIRMGGNPQDAPIWLIGIVVGLGLLLLGLIKWLVGFGYYLGGLAHAGPREWARFAITTVYFILAAALLVRVIGSWLGMGRYNRWIRFAYRLTDWLVEPIRRILPPFGIIDLSPLLAWFVLWLARLFLTSILA